MPPRKKNWENNFVCLPWDVKKGIKSLANHVSFWHTLLENSGNAPVKIPKIRI